MSDADQTDRDDEATDARASEPIDAEFAEVSEPRAGRGPGALVLAVLAGALLGGGIGAGAAWQLDRMDGAPDEADVAESDSLGELRGTVQSLADRVDSLDADLEAANAAAADDAGDAASASRLADLESRVEALAQAVDGIDASGPAGAFDPAPLQARLDSLQATTGDLEARLGGFEDRLDALESALPRSGEDPRAGEALARADAAADEAEAANARMESFDARLAELERIEEGGAAQVVFLYAALREAALEGDPFQLELAALETEIDAPALGALRPLAAEGVATEAELLASLPVEAVKTARAGEGGLGDRARGALSSLGTLRRSDEAAPEDPLALARERLEEGDVAGAVEAMERLGGAAAEAAESWLSRARDRRHAEDSLDALRDQLMETGR